MVTFINGIRKPDFSTKLILKLFENLFFFSLSFQLFYPPCMFRWFREAFLELGELYLKHGVTELKKEWKTKKYIEHIIAFVWLSFIIQFLPAKKCFKIYFSWCYCN